MIPIGAAVPIGLRGPTDRRAPIIPSPDRIAQDGLARSNQARPKGNPMLRQYFASPFMGGNNPLRIGTIAVGSIYFIQDDGWWRDRYRTKPICRNPWIVEAFLNGVYTAARKNPDTAKWEDLYITGRSDLAIIRSLRDGRRKTVAVRILRLADDEGHYRSPPTYPDHPSLSLVERYLGRNRGFPPMRRAA